MTSRPKGIFRSPCFSGSVLFLVCSFAVWGLIPSPVAAQTAADPFPVVELKDSDADGIGDVFVETERLRILLSGKTGDIAYYYLKGTNFEENLYPPKIVESATLASSQAAPFSTTIGKDQIAGNFVFAVLEKNPEKVVIKGSATLLPPETTIGKVAFFKTYSITNRGYSMDIQITLTNQGDVVKGIGDDANGGISLRYGPGLFLDPPTPNYFLTLTKETTESFTDLTKLLDKIGKETFTGIGLKTNYFAVLLDSQGPVKLSAHEFDLASKDPRVKKGQMIGLTAPNFVLNPGDSKNVSFQVYFGPKILDQMRQINREQVTDYGFLSTLLLKVLQTFNAIYPSYGLSIIFLTLLVRAVLYPLTLKSTKSMAQVQKIQPLVQDLKDRFRDNPQKFNEEVLKLYQKHDVNPLGGCLPMLLQLPVLIALYNTINIAVELRKTPFLWLPDLSKPDPLVLLPIAIAALMYIQQGKMTDPQQQQMMSFMPMFMFIITWSLPSGLLVYWFTSTVLGIFQQIQANRIMMAMKEE